MTPYNKGFKAFRKYSSEKEKLKLCPFKEGQEERGFWLDGWNDAFRAWHDEYKRTHRHLFPS